MKFRHKFLLALLFSLLIVTFFSYLPPINLESGKITLEFVFRVLFASLFFWSAIHWASESAK
jgi:hypothetical protein